MVTREGGRTRPGRREEMLGENGYRHGLASGMATANANAPGNLPSTVSSHRDCGVENPMLNGALPRPVLPGRQGTLFRFACSRHHALSRDITAVNAGIL